MTFRNITQPNWRMLRTATARWMVIIAASLCLSGCIYSDQWLFTPQERVLPLKDGQYRVERFSEGSWKPENKPITMISSNETYALDAKPSDRPGMSMVRLSPRFYLGFVPQEGKGGGGLYFLIEPKDGAYLIYFPACVDFRHPPIGSDFPPDRLDDSDRTCVYSNRNKLIGALVTYGDTAVPMERWTYAGPASLAPGNDTPAPTASDDRSDVQVCNVYDQTISVMIIHRHPHQATEKLLRGWYTVDAKQCQTLGTVPRGEFFLYAETADRSMEWKGTDVFACLARRATERTFYSGQTCVAGEEKIGFFVQSADGEKSTVRLD